MQNTNTQTNKLQMKGYALVVLAGVMWGFSDSCGQYAFAHYPEFSAKWLTVLRMIIAGSLLCSWNAVRSTEKFTAVWKDKKDAVQVVLFAVCGLMLSQFTTFEAIRQTNAGTATVLQSLFPVLLLLWTCLMEKRSPKLREMLAVALAVLGVFLLTTHGNIHTMILTLFGLFWGLMAAVTAAGYTLLSMRLVRKYGSVITIGYGLLIGGIAFAGITRIWTIPLILGPDGWLAVAGTIGVGTLFTYGLYVLGCTIIGPVKGSLIAMMEPVTATFLAVVWLGSSFMIIDLLGLICIFMAVALLTKK